MGIHPIPTHLILSALFFSFLCIPDGSSEVLENNQVSTNNNACPPWQAWNSESQSCKCSRSSLQQTVLCQNTPYSLSIFACFCMTHKTEGKKLVVGACQFTCKTARSYYTNITTNTSLKLSEVECGRYNREGQMCGSCKQGYSPPVYSYSLSCVECTSSHWGRYIAVSLLPVTVFYIIVVTFRISATSPTMNGLVICLQLLLTPPNQRLIETSRSFADSSKVYLQIIISLLGVWNLDFLRTVYTPFCLKPDMNTLQVLALDYLIALYPLFLIALSYLLFVLYYANVPIIFRLFKHIVPIFIRFRKKWNIKHSLVDAFATFILLSYVKILTVSVDLLLPVALYDQNEERLAQLYLFNQGDVPYFGKEHLPYACLALFFLVTFTLLPMLLLFLYPCSCFQVCLNRRGWNCQSLHIFMDSFQGHLKDGTNGTRDLRFFSGLYLVLRALVYASTFLSYQIASSVYTSAIISILAISVALARPYKKNIHNVIDAAFLTILQLLYVTLDPIAFGGFTRLERGLALISSVLLLLPLLYLMILLVCKIKYHYPTYIKKLRDEKCPLTHFLHHTDYQSV